MHCIMQTEVMIEKNQIICEMLIDAFVCANVCHI